MGEVTELRLVVTVDDFAAAVRFYRDELGLAEAADFDSPGRVLLLDAGRATVELADRAHAEHIDDVEVGRRVAGRLRVGLRVADVELAAGRLEAAGATVLAPPTLTPWGSRNARLEDPDGVQLTLFGPSPDGAPD